MFSHFFVNTDRCPSSSIEPPDSLKRAFRALRPVTQRVVTQMAQKNPELKKVPKDTKWRFAKWLNRLQATQKTPKLTKKERKKESDVLCLSWSIVSLQKVTPLETTESSSHSSYIMLIAFKLQVACCIYQIMLKFCLSSLFCQMHAITIMVSLYV